MIFSETFFQLERALLKLQEKLSRLPTSREGGKVSLAKMQAIVDEAAARKDIDKKLLLEESKIFAALGPNEENQTIFGQQKYTIGMRRIRLRTQ